MAAGEHLIGAVAAHDLERQLVGHHLTTAKKAQPRGWGARRGVRRAQKRYRPISHAASIR
jgi:hypothetical protein